MARETVGEIEPNDTPAEAQVIACGDVVDPATIVNGTELDSDWFKFDGTAGTLVTAGTAAGVDPAVGDTKIWLYAEADTENHIAYNDDGGEGLYSLIAGFELPADGVYLIKVMPYSDSYEGNYVMHLVCEGSQEAPENDLCDGAIVLESCTTGSVEGDLTFANNDYDPEAGGCTGYSAAGNDVVYAVDLAVDTIVDLTYTGNSYDASFYVITDCTDPVNSCVIGADDPEEILGWIVPATDTYYIIIDAYGAGNGGEFTLEYAFDCEVPPLTGACCIGEVCTVVTEDDCLGNQGVYQGDDTTCDPNPCELPSATEDASWGQIKSQYK